MEIKRFGHKLEIMQKKLNITEILKNTYSFHISWNGWVCTRNKAYINIFTIQHLQQTYIQFKYPFSRLTYSMVALALPTSSIMSAVVLWVVKCMGIFKYKQTNDLYIFWTV